MPRRIITEAREAGGTTQTDTFFDRVIKYIPADIVAAWTTVLGLTGVTAESSVTTNTPGYNRALVLWVAFICGAMITLLWTLRQTREGGTQPAWTQSIVATGAFAVWVYALGGPFAEVGWYNAVIGSIALIGYTLLVALIIPPEK